MYIICYLAHDVLTIPAVQERLAMADPPMVLVTARSAPELINQVQTLPVRTVLVDVTWPRSTWTQLKSALSHTHPDMPVYAMSSGPTDHDWWVMADDLLRLDESLELFLHRLRRAEGNTRATAALPQDATMQSTLSGAPAYSSPTLADAPSLLENTQFRQFAAIISGNDESALIEDFVAWVQQACQTSRALVLLRDPESGDFTCCAQRGLPSTLVRHCTFPQTAPLCLWLTRTCRILLKDQHGTDASNEVLNGLDLMQAVAAVPLMYDGQLVGILGIGPRLVGQGYNASELEALFALGGQIAIAMHHCRMHRTVRNQQEMTEHMLGVMPTGTIVLGADMRIAFVNATAATILGKPRPALQGMDLRTLPSPLGDLAYEVLLRGENRPRQVLTLSGNNRPIAVSCLALATAPPSSLLLLEDLSAQKAFEEERERRVNLEVVTNLVHYLAHELRNPLVALSTFSNLVHTRAGEPEFQDFCESVLQSEIGRVNLMLEQLLVLTNHVEFQFTSTDLASILERITRTEESQGVLIASMPSTLPPLYADRHQLETALTCILRSATRFSDQQSPATVHVNLEEQSVIVQTDVPASPGVIPERLLNPWQQFLDESDEHVDLGLATAHYIIAQHEGSLSVSIADNVLTIICRLPLRTEHIGGEEVWHDDQKGARC